MPWEVRDAGTVTTYAGGTPDNASTVRLLNSNALRHSGTLFPSLTSNRANPLAEDPTRQLSNIVTAHPQEVGVLPNVFQFSALDNIGNPYFASGSGNHSIKIDGTTIDLRTSAPTRETVVGNEAARVHVEDQIQASGLGNAAGFRVAHGSANGFKWTISHVTDTFNLETVANSAYASLGDIAAGTGAQSYTSLFPQIHHLATFIAEIDPVWTDPDRSNYAINAWKYFYLVNCNYGFSDVRGSELPFLRLYIATDADDLDETAESVFLEGTDRFSIVATGGARSTFAGLRRGTVTSGLLDKKSYINLIDCSAPRALVPLNDPTEKFVRLSVHDPRNPDGEIFVGYMGIDPGFWPTFNVLRGYDSGAEDRATLSDLASGGLGPTWRDPRRVATYEFGQENPLSLADIDILRAHMEGVTEPEAPNLGYAGSPAFDLNAITGNAHPCLVLDPSQAEADGGSGGLTSGAIFGFATWDRPRKIQTDQHGLTITVVENR